MKTSNELVSIIMPVYNCEAYLEEALSSAVTQSYANIEIIIVDDGSEDRSLAICQEFAAKDQRIRIMEQRNGGAANARNTGLLRATGEYILFLDSDDILSEQAVETLLTYARDTEADIVVCGDTVNREILANGMKLNRLEVKLSGREFLLTQNFHQVLWAKLYRRDVWINRQIPLIPVHEDVAILYKLFYEATTVVCCEELLYYNRIREGSLSEHGKISLRQMDRILVIEEKIQYFKEHREVKLCQMAIKEYVINLLTSYDELMKFYPEQNSKRQELKSKYRKFFAEAIKCPEKKSYQLSLILAYINPGWWMKLAKIKDKVK